METPYKECPHCGAAERSVNHGGVGQQNEKRREMCG